jgi:ABC-type nitrate/sulfonate/bicarbonate transport system substrate-binding protein
MPLGISLLAVRRHWGALNRCLGLGVELKIVYGAIAHLGDLSWMVRKDSPIKSIADLRGRKVAFSSPQSVTEMAVRMVMRRRIRTSFANSWPCSAMR